MIPLRHTVSALLIAWLGVCADIPAARVPTGIRLRTSRCMRLDIDHSVDLSRDGESNSLGAHYSRQEVLGYKGASTKAAVALAHPTPAVLTGGFRISAPGLAFLSPVAAPPQAIPILQDYGVAQGRAPPSLHS